MTKRTGITAALLFAAVAAAGVAYLAFREAPPAPAQAADGHDHFGGRYRAGEGHFSGCGWSTCGETAAAVAEAASAIPPGALKTADIAFVFYTPQHDPQRVLEAAGRSLGPSTEIIGWSTQFGVLSSEGYHSSPEGAVGLLAARLRGVEAGAGSAGLDESASPEACARLALERATLRAGKARGERPSFIIISPTYDGCEERYLAALSEALGESVPVLGGTAGGNATLRAAACSAITRTGVTRKGLVLAAFFSDRPFGWAYGGGYDRTGKSGVVTASEGRVIRRIDGRPALDVYDEWCGGRMREAMRAGGDLNRLAALYPLCRIVTRGGATHNLFIHAWPPDSAAATDHLISSASLHDGDVVHFAEGNWNSLLNRVGALPQAAKARRPGLSVAAGLLVCCEGILQTIPPDQRGQMSRLVNRHMGGAPWLGVFTWGEQGNVPALGNFHGNLQASVTLFPAPPAND
jgi:hypothetical protein